MTIKVKPIPEGMHSLTPHLICRNDNAAMDFYIKAFGATEGGRVPGPGGKLMHGMLRIGDSALMLVDENPGCGIRSPLSLNGSPVTAQPVRGRHRHHHAQAVAAGDTDWLRIAALS